MEAAVAETQGMSPYEAARERNLQENKRKMEALNLRHLSAVIKEAPKTPSPMKPKRRRIIEDAVVVPSPPRRSRRLANVPEVKYAEIAPHRADRMTRSPRRPADLIYLARRGSISMKARLEATRKAEELESQLDPEIPSFVKAMLHSHVVRGFWLGLPSHFCDTYMPKQDATITLVDEKDEEFDTNYLAYKKGLSGGWAGFALYHAIQDGDSTVFQLIKPTTFKVHIVRAATDDSSEVDE
ncbi:B3 domain-containing protein [Zea mays]|uniref:B3 domain-containing protein n=1 Tax=Zea mays TaxID=4577 RepID=C4J903_MAIZE|nr:B3 domain-containing protein [Zea mays]ACR37653.1 unknown [Zea mays]ONL94339.1 B3 domain-containing protein [Zea mays]|eukprot:NP_001345448.1 B3 domain-containing protein [Zea mays]